VATVGVAGFILRSARHDVPVIQLGLFRDRIFSAANLTALLAFASFSILLLSAILWMQGHWHYSAIRTGLGSAPGPVMFAVFAGVAETLQVRFKVPAAVVASVGFVIAAIGGIMMANLLHNSPNYASGLLPTWIVLGLGFGLAVPTTITFATVDLPPEQAATGSAIVSMALQLGAVIGISTLVAILGTASAGAGLDVFRSAWFVAAGLSAVSILTVIGINPKRRPSRARRQVGVGGVERDAPYADAFQRQSRASGRSTPARWPNRPSGRTGHARSDRPRPCPRPAMVRGKWHDTPYDTPKFVPLGAEPGAIAANGMPRRTTRRSLRNLAQKVGAQVERCWLERRSQPAQPAYLLSMSAKKALANQR